MVNHCTLNELRDIDDLLSIIRSWPGIHEPKPAVFYVRQQPFLHFLASETQRWANVRRGPHWGLPLAIPMDATPLERKRFIREVKDRYCVTTLSFARRAVA
jgi:hypothetical protein